MKAYLLTVLSVIMLAATAVGQPAFVGDLDLVEPLWQSEAPIEPSAIAVHDGMLYVAHLDGAQISIAKAMISPAGVGIEMPAASEPEIRPRVPTVEALLEEGERRRRARAVRRGQEAAQPRPVDGPVWTTVSVSLEALGFEPAGISGGDGVWIIRGRAPEGGYPPLALVDLEGEGLQPAAESGEAPGRLLVGESPFASIEAVAADGGHVYVTSFDGTDVLLASLPMDDLGGTQGRWTGPGAPLPFAALGAFLLPSDEFVFIGGGELFFDVGSKPHSNVFRTRRDSDGVMTGFTRTAGIFPNLKGPAKAVDVNGLLVAVSVSGDAEIADDDREDHQKLILAANADGAVVRWRPVSTAFKAWEDPVIAAYPAGQQIILAGGGEEADARRLAGFPLPDGPRAHEKARQQEFAQRRAERRIETISYRLGRKRAEEQRAFQVVVLEPEEKNYPLIDALGTSKDARNMLEDFIVSREAGDATQPLAEEWEIDSLPALVVLDPAGQVVGKTGSSNPTPGELFQLFSPAWAPQVSQ